MLKVIFATKIFSATQRCYVWNNVITIRNNAATLCCANNRRCESSRTTSVKLTATNGFVKINMKGCSSNNIKRNLIQ